VESPAYEYSPLPNSWETEMLTWEQYYQRSMLGGTPGTLTDAEHDRMAINLHFTIEVMIIEHELEPVQLPEDVYNVFLVHHMEGRDLPCQQSI
jgi:hypothetical protein